MNPDTNKKEYCKHGHKLTPDNTFVTSKGGYIGCKTCRRAANLRWKASVGVEKIKLMDNEYRRKAHDRNFFGGNREKVIQRDGEKCVNCGLTRQEHRDKFGRDITVDHIDGMGRNTPIELQNNNMDNLQTLCLYCHWHKDSNPEKYNELTGRMSELLAAQHAADIEAFRDMLNKTSYNTADDDFTKGFNRALTEIGKKLTTLEEK